MAKTETKPKAGDIAFVYQADPDWFDDHVELDEAIEKHLIVSVGVGGELRAVGCQFRYVEHGHVATYALEVESVYPTVKEALEKALKSSKEYAEKLKKEIDWIEEKIKELENDDGQAFESD